MVDMWSRLTISIIVERKKPKEVIDVIMGRWIGYFGTMKAVLNDNEFTAQEVDSTGAHVILIENSIGDCAPMVWNANKTRIVGSALEAECLALVDGAKEAVYLR